MLNLYNTWIHLKFLLKKNLFCTLSQSSFLLQWQNWTAVTGTVWPTKLEVYSVWLSMGSIYQPDLNILHVCLYQPIPIVSVPFLSLFLFYNINLFLNCFPFIFPFTHPPFQVLPEWYNMQILSFVVSLLRELNCKLIIHYGVHDSPVLHLISYHHPLNSSSYKIFIPKLWILFLHVLCIFNTLPQLMSYTLRLIFQVSAQVLPLPWRHSWIFLEDL